MNGGKLRENGMERRDFQTGRGLAEARLAAGTPPGAAHRDPGAGQGEAAPSGASAGEGDCAGGPARQVRPQMAWPPAGRRRPRPGWLSRFLLPATSWLVTNATVTLFWIVFFVLNRTIVIGREHVGSAPNTLLLSNHQSMIDSFLVGMCAFYPRSLVKPRLMPWNPAAMENFYKNRALGWLAHNWHCIPVREGRRDPFALRRMIEVLPRGVITLFPEGTRSRDGTVGPGRTGAGYLMLATRPRVVPVAIQGMHEVLPIGSNFPRIGKHIHVLYGPPVEYADLLTRPRTRETAQALVDRVMARIRTQHAELRRMRRERVRG